MTLFWGRPAPGARWTQYLRAGYFELHMAKHDEEKLLFFLKWWKPIAQRKDKTNSLDKQKNKGHVGFHSFRYFGACPSRQLMTHN